MRAYFFGNMYLSQIQQGIQAGHVIGEMSVQYYAAMDGGDETGRPFYEWASFHKTMILLNGGYGENLHDLVDFFDQRDNDYPWAFFKESEPALDNALTSVGIILPEKIYEGIKVMNKTKRLPRDMPTRMLFEEENILRFDTPEGVVEQDYSDWEVELMERVSKFRLA